MKLPFSVFKRANRRFYLVKFKNDQTGDYFPFLKNFWEWDSPYIKEKLRKRHAIHQRHAKEMAGVISKYWIP